MKDELQSKEHSIHGLVKRIEQLEERVAKLEVNKQITTESAKYARLKKEELPPNVISEFLPDLSKVKVFSIIGRTFLILAGAFLLRVFTENGTLQPMLGAIIGLVYALLWLIYADRSAVKNENFSASFYGVSSVLIAFPLVFESTTKLSIFLPSQTVLILFVISGIAFFISLRRKLRSVYSFYVLAALITSAPLVFKTGKVELFAVFMIAISLSTLVFKYSRDWNVLPWVSVFFTNLVIIFLATIASNPERAMGSYANVSSSISLFITVVYILIYLAGFVAATLFLKRQISVFGMFQSLFVLIIGLASAISITHGTGSAYKVLGIITLVLSVKFYFIAFLVIKPESKVNFYYYTWMAFILAIAGIWIIGGELTRVLVFGFLSLLSIFLTKYIERLNTLGIQSALYLLLAVIFSSTLKVALASFVSSELSYIVFSPPVIYSLIISIAVYFLHVVLGLHDTNKIQITRFVVLIIVITCLCGLIISLCINLFAFDNGTLKLDVLALIRTIVLAISAVVFALLSRKYKFRELSHLIYPILIIGGLKLLFQDLGNGTPLTLFIGFVFYGFALIAAPKIKFKQNKQNTEN